MKLQFSLATLLVCVTVLAVVCSIAGRIKVHQPAVTRSIVVSGSNISGTFRPARDRPPITSEVAERVALWGIPSIATTLAILWLIRRLRQPNRPPVG